MQDDVLRLIALLLISAANADGYIHPREEKVIRMELGSQTYLNALEEYQKADSAGRLALSQEVAQIEWNTSAKEQILSLLKKIFLADGQYDPEEGSWMKKVWDKIT